MNNFLLLLYIFSLVFCIASLIYSMFVYRNNKKRIKRYEISLKIKKNEFQKKMKNLGR